MTLKQTLTHFAKIGLAVHSNSFRLICMTNWKIFLVCRLIWVSVSRRSYFVEDCVKSDKSEVKFLVIHANFQVSEAGSDTWNASCLFDWHLLIKQSCPTSAGFKIEKNVMEEKLILAVSSFLIISDAYFLEHRNWSECAAAWKKVSEITGR